MAHSSKALKIDIKKSKKVKNMFLFAWRGIKIDYGDDAEFELYEKVRCSYKLAQSL